MKLFFHCCASTFNNCYILGQDYADPSLADDGKKGDAIIIDPGSMDADIVHTIEKNGYGLRAVFITHDHRNHTAGLRALSRIYSSTEVYAAKPQIADIKTTVVRDERTINIGPFHIDVIFVPGHSPDSVVYKVGRILFTGDALTAGLIGATASSYGAMKQVSSLQNRVFTLPGNYIILAGHGPPSTLEAERRFNVGVSRFESSRSHRRNFNLEFLE